MGSCRMAVCLLGFVLAVFGQNELRKLTRAESASAVTSKVAPEYPPMARQLKLQGTVELEVVLTETGAVDAVKIISGNPVLTKPAVDAVKKWKFEPQTEGGKPGRAIATVAIAFKL